MKFFSKNANLMIVLKPGLQGSSQLGTASTPGVYARFKDGMFQAPDETFAEMMKKHPGFNVDFVVVEEVQVDPFAKTRQSSEPAHVIEQFIHGTPTRVGQAPAPISAEVKAMLMGVAAEMAKPMAVELAKAMLPEMVKETLKALNADKVAPEPVNNVLEEPKKPAKTKK